MDKNFSQNMPLDFQMALAHSPKAMSTFLRLDDKSQDELIEKAHHIGTKREMMLFVEGIKEAKI
ncbi:MAG: hypothetical protein IJ309_03650 [Clostridia bacterium]|nr:hypothetical protein [Clostridia bacterium]